MEEIYCKTKLVHSKNGTTYRRKYYDHELDEEREIKSIKNKYIKTISSNTGKTYYKHPENVYKHLHEKNYERNKEKIGRRMFLYNLKKATRTPHAKSIVFYKISQDEVENIKNERIQNEPEDAESIGKLYNDIIEKIQQLKTTP